MNSDQRISFTHKPTRKFKVFIFIVLLVIHFLKIAKSSLISTTFEYLETVNEKDVHKNIINVFHNFFHQCHFKMYVSTNKQNIMESYTETEFNKLIYTLNLHFTSKINDSMFPVSIATFHIKPRFLENRFANYILKPNSSNTFRVTKRATCFAHIYIASTEKQQFVNKVTLKEETWNDNPDHVIILRQNAGNLNNLEELFIDSFYKSSVLYVITSFQTITEICFMCSSAKTRVLNLERRYLATDLNPEEKIRKIRSCDQILEYTRDFNAPTVEACILHALGTKLNFSLTDSHYRSGATEIKRRKRLSMNYFDNEVKPNMRVIVELGLVFEEWGFLTIQDKRNGSHLTANATLSNPFDFSIWIILGVSFVLMVVVLETGVAIVDELSFKNITMLIPIRLLGSMLEQSGCTPTNIQVKKLMCPLYQKYFYSSSWVIWYFAVFVLSQFYKGKMFSYLTQVNQPWFSKSLNELTEISENFDIITFIGEPQGWQSILEMHLKEVIETGIYPEYYPKILKLAKYKHDWLFGMRKFSVDLFLQHNLNMLPNGSSIKTQLTEYPMQTNFAELDLLKHVKMQKHILGLYTPNSVWTSPVIQAQNFMTCMPWTVTRNAFYPILKHGLGQIFESGLYTRWDNFHDDINGMVNLYDVEKKLKYAGIKTEQVNFPVEKMRWRNYYFHSKWNPDQEQMKPVPTAVSEKVFRVIWILVGILLCLASFLVLAELLYHHLYNMQHGIDKFSHY